MTTRPCPAVEPPHTVTVASRYGRDVTEVARRWHVISDLGTTAWLTESAALVEATNGGAAVCARCFIASFDNEEKK